MIGGYTGRISILDWKRGREGGGGCVGGGACHVDNGVRRGDGEGEGKGEEEGNRCPGGDKEMLFDFVYLCAPLALVGSQVFLFFLGGGGKSQGVGWRGFRVEGLVFRVEGLGFRLGIPVLIVRAVW
jgi:hypothetical protein